MILENRSSYFGAVLFILSAVITFSCSDFLELDAPKSKVESELVFSDDVTATSAVLGMYSGLMEATSFASGSSQGVATFGSLSSDELVNVQQFDAGIIQFQENELNAENPYLLILWSSLYKTIYEANVIIEGVQRSSSLTDSVKAQLLGEGLFMRAFCNFYLVNLFGDVPLVLTSNYLSNKSIARSPNYLVFNQIVEDLNQSKEILSNIYVATSAERVRVNSFAATAFLSRVYLYMGEWRLAEAMSTEVIEEHSLYGLEEDLDKVFLKNSSEAIWQLRPLFDGATGYTNEASIFSPESVLNYNVMRTGSVDSYEDGDLRATIWFDTVFVGSDTIYYPRKYKQDQYGGELKEYSMVLRLAEQFLIRAEARAMQDNLFGENSAVSDVNMIRSRAGLDEVIALSKEGVLDAVMQERMVELFSEWGHRWFDLKRTSRTSAILNVIKSHFKDDDELYPLPATEFTKNPSLKDQNQGY